MATKKKTNIDEMGISTADNDNDDKGVYIVSVFTELFTEHTSYKQYLFSKV